MVSLSICELTHEYEDRLVFQDLNFEFEGSCLSVTGHNGSGKSTFMRIIAGLLTPTEGSTQFRIDGAVLSRYSLHDTLGLVAPDLRLYGELTVRENLAFLASARTGRIGTARIDETMAEVGLADRANDAVRELSSGLRQRACFAAALLHEPRILLLDEPSTNLDETGIEMVRGLIDRQKKRGLVIIATNDSAEAALGQETLTIGAAR